MIKKFPRPKNIPNLKTPATSKELRKLDRGIFLKLRSPREKPHGSAKRYAIKAKNQIEPRTIFEVASDATQLLISAHNECSKSEEKD